MALTARQIGLFALTYFSYVALYFARKPVSVVKSTLETELSLSRSQLGMIDSSLLALYAMGQFLTGAIVGVTGSKMAVVLAFALSGTFCASFAFTDSASLMALLWGMTGLTAAVVNPLLVIFVADLFPASSRASAIGFWATSQQVGGVAANAVASYMLVTHGWRSVFTTSGAIVFVFAPLMALFLTEGSSAPTAADSKPAEAAPEQPGTQMAASNLPGARSVGAAYTLVKMSRYCCMFWLPYFFTKHVGLGASQAALLATLLDMGGVLGSIFTGIACDRFYGGRMIGVLVPFSLMCALAFAGWAAVCLLEDPAAPMVWAHVTAMVIVGFLISAPDGVLGGAASRNLCDYAGVSSNKKLAASVAGLVNGCGSIGAILQGGLTAKLVDVAGWTGLFGALAAAMVLSVAVLLPAVGLEERALSRSAGKKVG